MKTNLQPIELSPHRQRKRNQMVEKILYTARQIMRQEGVAALTMQELARRLDLRAPSLYNYFDSKLALYDALFRLGFTLSAQYQAEHLKGACTWQEEVQKSMEAYMSFAIDNPELFQLCFERPVPGFVPSEQSLELSFSMLQQTYQRFASHLAQLDIGLSPQQTTDLVIAMTHGLTAQHLANQPELPIGEGRFGSLIPNIIHILDRAWSVKTTST